MTTASLLVSELVTNSVCHGGSGPNELLDVRFDRGRGSLRVAVSQHAEPGDLHVVTQHEDRDGGWGLMLVDELSQDWGVGSDPNCVWFSLTG